MHRWMGDSRLIVAGGVFDQPIGEFMAVNYAGWLWYLLETSAKPDGDKLLSASDLTTLFGDGKGNGGLMALRMEIEKEIRG